MYRYRAEITKGEEIRYISHLDYANLIERSIRRSKLPAAYSEGFNPHMKISFASALPVGVASESEFMEFELSRKVPEREAMDRLQGNLPAGVDILRLKYIPEGENKKKPESLMAQANFARYEVIVPLRGALEMALDAVEKFNVADAVFVDRVTPNKTKSIDVKQYMASPVKVARSDNGNLTIGIGVAISPAGTVKPQEVLQAIASSYGLPCDLSEAVATRKSLKGKDMFLIG